MSPVPDAAPAPATVEDVAAAGLCCSCGMCEAVCPAGAVTIRTTGRFPAPVVDRAACAECGLCLRVCPGYELDFDELRRRTFGETAPPTVLGHRLFAFTGAVSDPAARERRTSGGLAKEVAIWGLETGRWDRGAISRWRAGEPLAVETVLADSPRQVDAASRSLYCPVPACAALRGARDIPGRVCFIGVPCHLHALRKAQAEVDWLRDKVVFAVGLFCSGAPGLDAVRAFLGYHGIDAGRVASFAYRSEGWPGDITVLLRGEAEPRRFPCRQVGRLWDRLRLAGAFQRRGPFVPRRCLVCPDHLAELADLSLGDAWHLGHDQERLGLNLGIVRTRQASEVLEALGKAGRIRLELASDDQVLQSQGACIVSKKKLGALTRLMQQRGVPVPLFKGVPNMPTTRADRWLARMELLQTALGARRGAWGLFPLLAPLTVLLRRLAERPRPVRPGAPNIPGT